MKKELKRMIWKRRNYHSYGNTWGRKLKYLAAFAFVFTILFMGAAIWGTVVLVNQVSIAAKPHLTQENVDSAKEKINDVISKPIVESGCLSQIQALALSPFSLLTVPISTHYENFQAKCLPKEKKDPNG